MGDEDHPPQLIPELFTAGRAAQADCVREWLTGQPACLRVRADTTDEAVGFIAAVSRLLDEASRERVMSRAVVVTTPDIWRAVAGQNTPVLLIATSPFGAEAQVIARGHHVAVVYGNDSAGVPVHVSLPHLRRAELEGALRRMNLGDDRCRDLAAESRGRIAAVVDLLGGGTAPPHWASPAAAPQLVPFLLAGSWCENPGDIQAVASLARVSADEVAQRLSRWANETDPPVRFVGGMWEWVSRQRAWPHLARHVTAADLTAFRQVASEVLGEMDPQLDLAPDQRWMASLHNCAPRYSEAMRKGVAETLAMLATYPNNVRAGADVGSLVLVTVRNLFGPSPDPRRWYSLAPVLPLLAEAAPSAFLTAVERDAVGNAAVRAILFQEEGYFGSSRHCHLLWALETLAWSPEYLCDTAVALGGLAASDPGGRTANRPQASLRTIFLPWHPCTTASVPQRLAAIDALNRHYPSVAFDLCLQLLPTRHDFATPTPRPRWRAWAAECDNGPPIDEYQVYVRGVYERALNWARDDHQRWARLLDPLPQADQELLVELIARLEAQPLERWAGATDDALRRAVRRILHQRRTIEGMYPELTNELVGRLERVYARLEPADPVLRDAWLFDNGPELFSIMGNDWRAAEEARERERRNVIQGFVGRGAADEVLRLAEHAGAAWAVGHHLGQSGLADEALTALLPECMNSESEKRRQCGQGAIGGRFRRDGWPWVERVFSAEVARGWPAAWKATFAFALPFETATWDWVEAWGEDVAAEYWRSRVAWVSDAHRDAPRAIQTLLNRGRPFAALHVTGLCMSAERDRGIITAELQLAVLRGITAVACGNLQTEEGFRPASNLGYELSQLLNTVEAAGVATEQELAHFDWIWLPVLEHTPRGPATLHRLLARDPALFAQVVAFIYRPRHAGREEEPVPEPDDLARARGAQAFRLLHEWRGVPGRDDNGGIDGAALRDWVMAARRAFPESGHTEAGDRRIGEVLARVPAGTDGVWPHEAVRELLEELCSEEIEEGVYLGVINGRGMTCRSPDDGGEQEMTLAARYAAGADALAGHTRITRVLRRLADNYRHDARREDDRRDLNEFYR